MSSNEQPNWNDGNFDSTHLNPGDVIDIPILAGPGYINHMWFTSHAGGMGELNALTLRIYWDGREEPGVEAPLGDFFACGDQPAEVESVPVQVSPSGALTCYWRMPFHESARITVTNDNPERGYGLYWQIDYVTGVQLPQDVAYFHAQYRQEYPPSMGRDYLIADLEGQGCYVGTVMTVTNAQDGWFGEGDDFFYVDGEQVPSLQGTGSEDYFNDGWGFRKRTSMWFGQPHSLGWQSGDSGILYRWHVLDPVHFDKSLRVNRAQGELGLVPRMHGISSGPTTCRASPFGIKSASPSEFGSLPSYPERSVPWMKYHFVPRMRQAECSGSSKLQVTTMGMFGGRPSLRWKGMAKNDTVTFRFVAGGRRVCRSSLRVPIRRRRRPVFPTRGSSGRPIFDRARRQGGRRGYQLRAARIQRTERVAGRTRSGRRRSRDHLPSQIGCGRRPRIGIHAMAASASACDSQKKTHNEAHFFRLGIGRAVYDLQARIR